MKTFSKDYQILIFLTNISPILLLLTTIICPILLFLTTISHVVLYFDMICIFQAAAAYLAFLRYKQGSDQAFAPSYEAEPNTTGGYNSYPDATDPDGGYSQPPFSGQPTQPQSGTGNATVDFGYQSQSQA